MPTTEADNFGTGLPEQWASIIAVIAPVHALDNCWVNRSEVIQRIAAFTFGFELKPAPK